MDHDAMAPRPVDPVYGMSEPVPDAPLWNDPRSIEGREKHFSWCSRCGRTWDWARPFTIPIAPGRGLFPVCRECGPGMSAQELLEVLERHDRHSAQFYPLKMGGRLFPFEPVDREFEKLGYDVESSVPGTGKLRFIEVKGRIERAETVTVSKNEILAGLNKPEDYILAVVEVSFTNDQAQAKLPHYILRPFRTEPDFAATSVNYDWIELVDRVSPG